MTTSSSTTSRFALPIGPGIAAATSLGISDVLAKMVLASGCDVLTMLSFRGVVGLAFMAVWLRLGDKAKADARQRWIALGIGIILAGVVYFLFKAIEAIDVPTAILSYFIYPLLTGIVASALGLERLRWQGVLCAVAAFFGLAVMIGAHPAGLAFAGVAFALAAACCRTAILLLTRAFLGGADARLSTWYSLLSSTVLFIALSLVTLNWQPPQTPTGWAAIVGMSLAITSGFLFIFVSTVRIGAFRTALIMNLEPLWATVLSAILLGEVITPLQGLGAAIMLAALVAFQLWR
jgi:drug/metabolite transporter (DMT)-like permease